MQLARNSKDVPIPLVHEDPEATVLPTKSSNPNAPAEAQTSGAGRTRGRETNHAAQTPAERDSSTDSSDGSVLVGPIVGGILGGLALLVLALLLWICRHRVEGCCAGRSNKSSVKAASSHRSTGSGDARVATGARSDKVSYGVVCCAMSVMPI